MAGRVITTRRTLSSKGAGKIVTIRGTVLEMHRYSPKPDGWFGCRLLLESDEKHPESWLNGPPFINVNGKMCQHMVGKGDILQGAVKVILDPKYGWKYQFQAEPLLLMMDQTGKMVPQTRCVVNGYDMTVEDIDAYLRSGVFTAGLSKDDTAYPMLITAMVSKYGQETLNRLSTRLGEMQAEFQFSDEISARFSNGLISMTDENYLVRRFARVLSIHDARCILGSNDYKRSDPIKLILEHPYKLAEVDGISFRKADSIAVIYCGVDPGSAERFSYVAAHAVHTYLMNKHWTYLNYTDRETMWGKTNSFYATFLDSHNTDYPIYNAEIAAQEQKTAVPGTLNEGNLLMTICDHMLIDLCQNGLPGKKSPLIGCPVAIGSDVQFHIYEAVMFNAIQNVRNVITSIIKLDESSESVKESNQKVRDWVVKRIAKDIRKGTMLLNDEQLNALRGVFSNRLSFVTGGPGRGKTYMIRQLVEYWRRMVPDVFGDHQVSVLMLAPTGRAVKNIKKATGLEENVMTIARFFALMTPKDDKTMPEVVPDLPSTLVVVDETSMVGVQTMSTLLEYLPNCHLVFVGDTNQLPPIEIGSFLAEMQGVMSEFPFYELHQNMRTNVPLIAENADRVVSGNMNLQYDGSTFAIHDISRVGSDGPKQDNYCLMDEVVHQYKSYLQVDNPSDVMILTPYSNAKIMDNKPWLPQLNDCLRDAINPKKDETTVQNLYKVDLERQQQYMDEIGVEIPNATSKNRTSEFHFRIGDRVIQTKNSMNVYDEDTPRWETHEYNTSDGTVVDHGRGMFNGDIGTIERFYLSSTGNPMIMIHGDDDRFYCLTQRQMLNIDLAFATTVHKSQGTECNHVIFVVPYTNVKPGDHDEFVDRRLFYTAVTRAKESVDLYCMPDTITRAINAYHPRSDMHIRLAEQVTMDLQAFRKEQRKAVAS